MNSAQIPTYFTRHMCKYLMRQLSGLGVRQNTELSGLSEVILLFVLNLRCDLGLYTLK
jgi:hypothetical protein